MRKEMQLELKAMHKELGITFIYVTHDQEEALTMSDKVVAPAWKAHPCCFSVPAASFCFPSQ